jgi:hypothetical protein
MWREYNESLVMLYRVGRMKDASFDRTFHGENDLAIIVCDKT